MNVAHRFHKGYDPDVPEPSARKEYSVPKIAKKSVKKKKKFKSAEETLNFVRAKSSSRDRKLIKDYGSFIAAYEKAKRKRKYTTGV